MNTFFWIISFCLLGGIFSFLLVFFTTFAIKQQHINLLVAYAIGALLGASFLEVLPHSIEISGANKAMATVLLGILLFFTLEKLVIWRHCHHEHCDNHDAKPINHDHGRSGILVIIGDIFHNFVDGVLIASAFMINRDLGIVTALAIVAHEIPQELGDYLVLINSGYSRAKALFFNFITSVATLAGGLLTYLFNQQISSASGTLLSLAAASMIYVAIADLIPGLHKKSSLKIGLQQAMLIAFGIITIFIAQHFGHD